MKKICFTKMTGAGNDFVVIDDRKKLIRNPAAFARRVCDRRWGIGADGLILVRKHPKAAYEMRYYNADGSYGGMCGNGGRCIAYFAIVNRIAQHKHTFFSVDHFYQAELKGNHTIALEMKNPSHVQLDQILTIPELNTDIEYSFVNTGSPHVVIDATKVFKQPLNTIEVERIGRIIRFHPFFSPQGTNVNFIERNGTTVSVRTYERGVEAETLACGTGSIASALISHLKWQLKSPVTILPKSQQKLRVKFFATNSATQFQNVVLTGPAEIVFTGTLLLL